MMEPITVELQLDNRWRLTFTPENVMQDDVPHSVHIDIECLNGDRWEGQISGQVKRDGCADWGGGRRTLFHWCGRKDAELLTIAYDRAVAIMATARTE